MHYLGCAEKSVLEPVFGLLCNKASFLNASLMWMLLLRSIPPAVHQKVRYNYTIRLEWYTCSVWLSVHCSGVQSVLGHTCSEIKVTL